MTRFAIPLAVALALAGAGLYFWMRQGSDTARAESAPTIIQAGRGAIRSTVASTGAVVSNLDVEIKCRASGEIITLPYDVSDTIEKGTLLVELDPTDEERNVRLAKVQLSSSQARLAQARQNLATSEKSLDLSEKVAHAELRSARITAKDRREKAERMKSLLDRDYASPEETETAETEAIRAAASLEKAELDILTLAVEREALESTRQDVVLAECQVESDQLALEEAERRLVYTKVYAPIAGVVTGRQVQIGQIISSPTNNVSGGTALMTLSDLSRVFVLASVDESDIGMVATGQHADVTVDAFPNLHFDGKVVRIATMGTNVSNVVTFEVRIEVLDEEKTKLRPEMTANVEILVAEDNDAIVLPTQALHRKGEHRYVLVRTPGQPMGEQRIVEPGIDDGLNVSIVSGLKEGEEVLLSGDGINSRWEQSGENQREERRRPGMIPGFGGGPPPPH